MSVISRRTRRRIVRRGRRTRCRIRGRRGRVISRLKVWRRIAIIRQIVFLSIDIRRRRGVSARILREMARRQKERR
jgi:hypothetical protein